VGWLLPERLIPAPALEDPRGFRLGEVIVVIPPPGGACEVELAERVTAVGYVHLEPTFEWQHFRPRSVWWARGGPGRHARLRGRDLLLRLEDDAWGGQRIHAVGLLTSSLERMLGALGPLYAPHPSV
jgi:hypothetical protein